jgi:import receptor subunit TOM20
MDKLMDTVSNWPWKKIAIGGTVAFVSYAIYFDYKRRSHPLYQEHIRERRRQKGEGGSSSAANVALPDMRNTQEVQAFFLQEVQLGEELMSSQNPVHLREGAEHLANAILFCGQSEQLLSIFQQTFPPEHFQLVLSKLPEAKIRLERHLLACGGAGGFGDATSSSNIVPVDDLDDLE